MSEHSLIITRPKLAARLMDAGESGTRCSNPFSPELCAWTFNQTPAAVTIIRAFYDEIGKPVPKSLENYAGEVSV